MHSTVESKLKDKADCVNGAVPIAQIPTGSTGTTVCLGNDARLTDARTPTTHASTHAPGSADAIATGSSSVTVCVGNDARLSDARTPTAHATSHKTGGSDAVKLDELAAPTDVTTLNATASAHGLCPKLSGGATTYLDGTGAFSSPVATAGDTSTVVLTGATSNVLADTCRYIAKRFSIQGTGRLTIQGTGCLNVG